MNRITKLQRAILLLAMLTLLGQLAGCSSKEPEPPVAASPNPEAAARMGLSGGASQTNLGSAKGRIAPPTK
jgi:hypothetical protein